MSDFDTAVNKVNNLSGKPTNEELLDVYALYKQSTVGDCNTDRPGMFNPKGQYKWDAWNKLKGKYNKEDAQRAYIDLANELAKTYGTSG